MCFFVFLFVFVFVFFCNRTHRTEIMVGGGAKFTSLLNNNRMNINMVYSGIDLVEWIFKSN